MIPSSHTKKQTITSLYEQGTCFVAQFGGISCPHIHPQKNIPSIFKERLTSFALSTKEDTICISFMSDGSIY